MPSRLADTYDVPRLSIRYRAWDSTARQYPAALDLRRRMLTLVAYRLTASASLV